jgi:hypothetical protein
VPLPERRVNRRVAGERREAADERLLAEAVAKAEGSAQRPELGQDISLALADEVLALPRGSGSSGTRSGRHHGSEQQNTEQPSRLASHLSSSWAAWGPARRGGQGAWSLGARRRCQLLERALS